MYKNHFTFVFFFVIVAVLSASSASAAPQVKVASKITRTLAGGTAYLGCMVKLEATIGTLNPNITTCSGSTWLSLDCDAVHHTQAASNSMWSSAMVAFSLNKTVDFWVDQDVQVGNHCVAQRVDVIY